jgi:hypothetical protein
VGAAERGKKVVEHVGVSHVHHRQTRAELIPTDVEEIAGCNAPQVLVLVVSGAERTVPEALLECGRIWMFAANSAEVARRKD